MNMKSNESCLLIKAVVHYIYQDVVRPRIFFFLNVMTPRTDVPEKRLTWIMQPFTMGCEGKVVNFVACCGLFCLPTSQVTPGPFPKIKFILLSHCRPIQFTS